METFQTLIKSARSFFFFFLVHHHRERKKTSVQTIHILICIASSFKQLLVFVFPSNIVDCQNLNSNSFCNTSYFICSNCVFVKCFRIQSLVVHLLHFTLCRLQPTVTSLPHLSSLSLLLSVEKITVFLGFNRICNC